MPEPRSVTFRDQTTGQINDLLGDEGKLCAHTQNLIGYLAGALLNYKDEGIEFSPPILICENIDLFLMGFPGGLAHQIGQAPLDPSSGPKILKDCAPLSSPNWSIFIQRDDSLTARYGVFTYSRGPTSVPLQDGITINPSLFCVMIQKVASSTIRITGAKGSRLTLIFSTTRESTTADVPIDNFSSACISDLPAGEPRLVSFSQYFRRLVESLLASCHGTILLCTKNKTVSSIASLDDCVPIDPPY